MQVVPSSRWSGGGCQGINDRTVSLADATTVSATFATIARLAIGIFRPATVEWFLDLTANGIWEGCNVDLCLGPFGKEGDMPVVGDWSGNGVSDIGVFRPSTGEWLLDLNSNGQWDGCNIDRCLRYAAGLQKAWPIVGDRTGSGIDMIGEITPGQKATWYLDRNGNGTMESCVWMHASSSPSIIGDCPAKARRRQARS